MNHSVHRSPVAGGTNGEIGWTCKDSPWLYSQPTAVPMGDRIFFKWENIQSIPHRRGKSWKDVLGAADTIYNQSLNPDGTPNRNFNEDKYELFEQTGTRAGVTYQ